MPTAEARTKPAARRQSHGRVAAVERKTSCGALAILLSTGVMVASSRAAVSDLSATGAHRVRLQGGRRRLNLLLPTGKLDMKDRAAAGRIIEAHLAAEARDDLLDDAQPEAGAALLPGVRGIGLRKLREDALLEILRNAVAVVSHGDTDGRAPVLDRDHDFFAPRREFDRVREEVGDDLEQPVRVATDVAGVRRGVKPYAHTAAIGEAANGIDRLLNKGADLDTLQHENDLAGLDLLHVEYAVDKPNQPLAVRARDREQAHRARRQGSARIVD